MSTNNTLYLVLLLLCVILSAFFSSAETAFTSLQKIRLQHLLSTNVRGAKRLAELLEHPKRLLSTILLGNNFVNIAATVLGTTLAIFYWGEKTGVVVATVGLTVLILIFGEITPKTIAAQHSERISISFTRPMKIICWFFSPFAIALTWIANLFSRMFGSTGLPHTITSADEIRTMITVGNEEGSVEKEEAQLLHNVFDFGDRPVREVMVPRPDVVCIEQGSKINDFLALYAESPMSRMPVFKENMDNVIGIITDKEVLVGLAKGSVTKDSLVDELTRKAYFAPETRHISKLFHEMRNHNNRMAIIVDEYGGTAGIVSVTRMVEEIVGEFRDELESEDKDFEVINEYTFQVDGSMRIDEVNEETELELPEGDYETVAGFILSRLGHIPNQGEQLRYKSLKMVITKMRGVKIEEILIVKEGHATTTN